jgi:hypothetical protein
VESEVMHCLIDQESIILKQHQIEVKDQIQAAAALSQGKKHTNELNTNLGENPSLPEHFGEE